LGPALGELFRLPNTARIALTRFGREALEEFATQLLGRPVESGLLDRLAEQSDGNPFFAEEMLSSAQFVASGELPQHLSMVVRARRGRGAVAAAAFPRPGRRRLLTWVPPPAPGSSLRCSLAVGARSPGGGSLMDIQQILGRVSDGARVQQVFGEPIERDGTLVVPVAKVWGGGGGGGGSEPSSDGAAREGMGGGFGLYARPAGVYVISGGDARWRPAVDVNRIVLGGQLVGLVALLVIRSVLRRKRH
jgi:uncharacterized spore protein YtfJ